MSQDIEVSIICMTYNQKTYIKDALESFLNQETNFNYEIIVHDDASTDGTDLLLKEYEQKYPELLTVIYEKENQYSRKVPIFDTFILPIIKGTYVAFCEGDDFWLSTNKLQRQYDVLQSNDSIDICTHSAFKVDSETKSIVGEIKQSKHDIVFSVEDVICGRGGFVATNSIFIKKSALIKESKFRNYLQLDYSLQILGALHGGMYYLSETMSCYRVNARNSWSVRSANNKALTIKLYEKIVNMLNIFNEETNHMYENAVLCAKQKYIADVLLLNGSWKLAHSKDYINSFSKMSSRQKMSLFLMDYLPSIYCIFHKLIGR